MTISKPSSTISSVEPRRRGLVDGTWTTCRLAGLSLLRGRRGWGLLLLGLLPTVPLVVQYFGDETGVIGIHGFIKTIANSYFQFVLGIASLYLACAAVGEDIEARTIPYLLTRAVPRSSILIGRYLSFLFSSGVLLGFYVVVVYVLTIAPMGVEALAEDLCYLWPLWTAGLIAMAAHGAVFLLLSIVARRAIFIGIALLFFWQVNVLQWQNGFKKGTVLFHTFVLLEAWRPHPEFAAMTKIASDDPQETAARAGIVLLSITAIALFLAVARFRRREFTFTD